MSRLDRFAIRLGAVLAWGFLIIVAMMCYEVMARYAFNAPTIWAHEIAGLIAAVAFVFGGAFCMAGDNHMRITSFIDARGGMVANLSKWLSIAAGTIYLTGLAYTAYRMTDDALFRYALDGSWDPERSGSTWNSPFPSFIKLALLLATVLFLLVLLRRIWPRPSEPPAG